MNNEGRFRLWLAGKINFAQLCGMEAIPTELAAAGGAPDTTEQPANPPAPGGAAAPPPPGAPAAPPANAPGATPPAAPPAAMPDMAALGTLAQTPAGRAYATLPAEWRQRLAAFGAGVPESVSLRATNFIEGMVREGRLLPYELEANMAEAVRRVAEDTIFPATIAYSVPGQEGAAQGTRFEAFQATLAARPQHQLTVTHVDPTHTVVPGEIGAGREAGGAAAQPQAEMPAARRAELLGKSQLGREILAREKRQGSLRSVK